MTSRRPRGKERPRGEKRTAGLITLGQIGAKRGRGRAKGGQMPGQGRPPPLVGYLLCLTLRLGGKYTKDYRGLILRILPFVCGRSERSRRGLRYRSPLRQACTASRSASNSGRGREQARCNRNTFIKRSTDQ